MAATALLIMTIFWCFFRPILDIFLTSYVYNIIFICSSIASEHLYRFLTNLQFSMQNYVAETKLKIAIFHLKRFFHSLAHLRQTVQIYFPWYGLNLLFANRATNIYLSCNDKQINRRIVIAQRWHINTSFAICKICNFQAPLWSTFQLNFSWHYSC